MGEHFAPLRALKVTYRPLESESRGLYVGAPLPFSTRPFGSKHEVGSPKQSHTGPFEPKANNIVMEGRVVTIEQNSLSK